MNILKMSLKELLALDPADVTRPLTADEIFHMGKLAGAWWEYDYGAAAKGWVGMHALLKSELHSDGFFVSKVLLKHSNLRRIIAWQIVGQLHAAEITRPDYVAGIPDGAKALGTEVAEIMGAPEVWLEKENGRIVLPVGVPDGARLLLVEDFCTRGTGFTEAILEIKRKSPRAKFVHYNPCILNRGGLKKISVDGIGSFQILPVVEKKIQDWKPVDCPLCKKGSMPIKPKATDENWERITTSQFAATALE
ncbi:MAG: hypothetical protein HY432_02465 [Candidatus Liptonbacteria bacterium]|nr:hypothetical protein [Candidatus Liptonbacteria bacterium]